MADKKNTNRKPPSPTVLRAISGLQQVLTKNKEALKDHKRIVDAARNLHRELVEHSKFDKCVL
jgi:hypothetical protein